MKLRDEVVDHRLNAVGTRPRSAPVRIVPSAPRPSSGSRMPVSKPTPPPKSRRQRPMGRPRDVLPAIAVSRCPVSAGPQPRKGTCDRDEMTRGDGPTQVQIAVFPQIRPVMIFHSGPRYPTPSADVAGARRWSVDRGRRHGTPVSCGATTLKRIGLAVHLYELAGRCFSEDCRRATRRNRRPPRRCRSLA